MGQVASSDTLDNRQQRSNERRNTMSNKIFRITIMIAAAAMILTACAAPTLAPVSTKVPTVPVILPTNMPVTAILPIKTLEPTATQVVLGVIKDRIAFYSTREGNNEIYVMNGDGSGVTNLTNNPGDDFEPAWSPDGKKIAFWSNRDGNNEVYVMNADGSDQTNLTNNPADDGAASTYWSPDGKKIVFASDRDGNRDVFVMNADGTNPTNLTNNPADDDLPAWSPDGVKIAFTSDRGGIYVMNSDGSNQTLLHKGGDAFPRWSPDGKKIAFWNNDSGNPEVFVMDADGKNPTNLTNNPADDVVYSWSADGTQIAFDSDRNNNRDIYIMNVDGSGLTRLTDNPAYDGAPALEQP
jgi:Tol biopolymer transport system component